MLGYEPTVDIREGVQQFIEWYRTNQDWYDPLVRNSCDTFTIQIDRYFSIAARTTFTQHATNNREKRDISQ